jgi:hypothetical protein
MRLLTYADARELALMIALGLCLGDDGIMAIYLRLVARSDGNDRA